MYNAAVNKLNGKELELLIAILPDNNGSLYGTHSYYISMQKKSKLCALMMMINYIQAISKEFVKLIWV